MALVPCQAYDGACKAGCDFVKDGEPCWGNVTAVDEDKDGEWIHACEGHSSTFDGGKYEAER